MASDPELASSSPVETTAPPRMGNVRWYICSMLFFATSINYMDRQVLGILAPVLQHSIGWTEQQYSYVITAFQVAYAIGLAFAGRLIDRLGTRVGYALIMGVWSLAAMAHSLVTSVLGFGIARFVLGLGEAGNFPAAIKTTAEWFPQRERSLATGIFNSGANLGAILAPAIVPFVALRYSWRAAFLVTGFFSASWIAWWLLRYRRPADHRTVSASELAYIRSGASTLPRAMVPWQQLLRYRETWAFSIAKFLTDPIWWFYLYWLPKFFDRRFHLGLSHLGLPLIIVYNVSAIGSISGGWLPGLLNRHGVGMANARYIAMLVCACCVVPMAFAGGLNSEWAAVALLSLAAGAHQGWSANLYTTASDMFPRDVVGTVVGFGSTAGSVGGILFALGVGRVLQLTHNYAPLFTVCAVVYLLALLILRLMVPRLAKVTLDPLPGGAAEST